jgi:hypothetical protein
MDTPPFQPSSIESNAVPALVLKLSCGIAIQSIRTVLSPVSTFRTVGSEGPHMIGRERTGMLSPNHMRAFRLYGSESCYWV